MNKNSLSLAIACALMSSMAAVSSVADDSKPNSTTAENECGADGCESPAPYTLKIISRGEGVPDASNDTPAGLQQNRRVDVSISTQVPATKEPVSAAAKPVAVLRDAQDSGASGGGTFWVSKDPASIDRVLGLKVPASVSIADDGQLANPMAISIATNYGEFIDRWEILVLPEGSAIDAEPLYRQGGKLAGVVTEFDWNGEIAKGGRVQIGDKFDVAVRVYDKDGNFDQTTSSFIEFVAEETDKTLVNAEQLVEEVSVKNLRDRLVDFNHEFARQSIEVSGSTVILRGTDLSDVQTVEVNGNKVSIAADDSFAVEYILPPGDHEFNVTAKRKSGAEINRTLEVEVKPGYFFLVGLADVTIGENKLSGSVEPLSVDQQHYGGDIFVDGRLAFYLKGEVKGKYLLTAQMDTGHDDISELFDDFNRNDERSLFRRIDPDEYYLVYGDDSSIVDDTDSQGKLYLRVDWDNSHALWGNFNTAFSGTEFAPFDRTLYGAQFRHSSTDTTGLGDTKTDISAFASEAQTAFRHNEFEGTGGSLYYLRDQDIVLGSEKVWVEVRRNNSEQVQQRITLVRGRDYEIDEFQGRIILNRPLLSASTQTGPSIIRDEPEPSDNTFLIVDYEYVPSDFATGDATVGARGKRWINNHIAIGGTWAHENRDTDDYDVKAFDVTLKKTNNTYLRFEVAESESSQTSGSFESVDGGLTFAPFNSNTGSSSGGAMGVEARVVANEIIDLEKPVTIAAWAKNREAGFSTASLDVGTETTDIGLEAVAEVTEDIALSARATRLEREAESIDSEVSVQGDYYYSDRTKLSAEVRRVNDEDLVSGEDQGATLAAGKVAVQVNDALNLYGAAQTAIDRSGNYESNTLVSLGAKANVSDRLSLLGEVSSGDRGTNVLVGAEQQVTDTYSIYGNMNVLSDSGSSVDQLVTIGQRKAISDKLKVYTEHQFSSEEARTGISNTVGLTNTFNRYATGTLSYQSSRIEGDTDEVDRDTLSAGFSFKRKQSFFTNKLELRRDRSETIDTDQWVSVTNLEYRHSPSLRIQGRFNHALTEDNIGNDDARFTEAGLGFAFRPITNDRLNMLGRYTYLFDLPPLSQSDQTDKRSSIFSFESIYELGKRWTIGGKLARREGEVRTLRQGGVWSSNDASLAAFRLRYKAPFGVDAMASHHWLQSDATDSMRQGALLSLGYNVGSNLQFSVGYNFTSFDDDLSNEDFDARGWFLNLVGKY